LSKLEFKPKGFLEPVSWRNNKWIIESPLIKNGMIKCKEKNRVIVAWFTLNPPHNQVTISSPIKGTAENRLVITVAPQNDICPQGKTYPKNAVAINIKRRVTPIFHTWIRENLP
jgi:hypothetical protein